MVIKTMAGEHRLPFADKIKSLDGRDAKCQ